MLCTGMLMMMTATAAAQQTDFDPTTYNPRFEVGVGGGISMLQSYPDWSDDQYVTGRLSFTMKIIDGLAIEYSRHIGYGSELGSEWFEYGPHYRVKANLLPYNEGTWAGIRVEVPMTTMRMEFWGIHSILISGGMVWDTYSIRGDTQEYYKNSYGYLTGDIPVEDDDTRLDRAADVDGYYVSAAARWHWRS